MLVLSRRKDQGVRLTLKDPSGVKIVVRVHKLKAGSVELSIDAPESVSIARCELSEQQSESLRKRKPRRRPKGKGAAA